MNHYFPTNLDARRNPHEVRRESNLRFLTNAPKRSPVKPVPNPGNSSSKINEPPPFALPLDPPTTQDESTPNLKLPDQEELTQAEDDEIAFLRKEMSDPKAESQSSSGLRRDNLHSRERNHPESKDRRGGHSDRHPTSGDNRRSNDRHSGPKRDHNGSSRPQRYSGGSFNSQMKSDSESCAPLPMHPAAFTQEIPKKKFTSRYRLFVGNLPNELNETEFREIFKGFGELKEVFLSGKGFGFVRLETRSHAEAAKEALDNTTVKGRQLRVRFAVNGGIIRVKELSPVVSNEMLYNTFSIFGEVERAIHIVDERGKPTGEGIIEFERKTSAQDALRSIEKRVFMMTAHSLPIQAEIMEAKDEDDGLAERMIQRTAQSMKEREVPPHFAEEASFEFSYGIRWKDLYKREKEQREQLEQQILANRQFMKANMEMAFEDYQTEKIREELEQRKRELDRLEEARRNRMSNRPPDFGAPWGNMPQRGFDEPPSGIPPFNHPPPGPNAPPMNAFDGPHNRPNPTFGREPRFFGGPENPEMRHQLPQEKQPFGSDIDRILQSFRGDNEPHRGERPDINKNPGFGPEGVYGAPPPFNAPLVPPLMGIPPQLMKQGSGRMHQMPPPEKRSRR